MNISILTVFPDLYTQFLETSLIKRAQEQSRIHVDLVSFFSCVSPKERIDAPTFGPGAGMLIKPTVIEAAVEGQEHKCGKAFKIFFSPQGKKLDQPLLRTIVQEAQKANHLMLVASRYEGIDARVEEAYADLVVSVGDFIVMGGDVPAMLLLEGAIRLLPGVVGSQESVERDSFSGALVDFPEYTAPAVWKERSVPDIVRSGNHEAIRQWRYKQAARKTILQHFGWFRRHCKEEDRSVAQEFIPPHYVILMHNDVLLPNGIVGTTSVTSFDIHDVSRSCRTFGIQKYFISTPLIDQQKIARTLIDFWQTGVGIDYNSNRHEAIKIVHLVNSLQEALEEIEKIHGAKPLLIGTSARPIPDVNHISYEDQAIVWQEQKPVLFIFGTGKGLTLDLLKKCDFMLGPVKGFSDFNHLSVRAAVSVILDRWLGIKN